MFGSIKPFSFLTFSFSYADAVDDSKVAESTSNVQQDSIISNNIAGKIFRDSDATILENSGKWYKISINGKTGWVHGDIFPVESIKSTQKAKDSEKTEDSEKAKDSEKTEDSTDKNQEVSTETTENTDKAENVTSSKETETVAVVIKGIIDGDDVNVREGPGKNYGVICQVDKGEKVEILESAPEWYHIKTSSGVNGWVYSTYVLTDSTLASRGGDTTSSDSSSKRAEIVEYAKQFLGVKYVYGGTSPNGFDCSGFVWYVFNHFGISLNRVASDQATQGSKVSKAELQPGDLVFFDTNGGMNKINHAGIYIGNGCFIHASSGSSAKKVVISNITSGFYNECYMTGRRVLE